MNWWKQAPKLASLALAVAIAGDVALTVSHLRALWLHGGDRTGKLHDLRGPTRANPRGPEVRQILAAHLFGEAARTQQASTSASKTEWVLTGVVSTEDPHAGFAMIGPSATAARLVLGGHEVARGVLLREIYADRVIIDLGDRQETLRLHLYDSSRSGSPAGETISKPAPPDADTEVADATQDQDDEFAPPPMTDEGAIWSALGVRPMYSGTQRSGARIFGTGAAAHAMSELGLDPGDVIIEVNGVPGGANFQYALGQVTDGDPLMLTVNRGGIEVPVTIDTRQIAAAADIYRAGQ